MKDANIHSIQITGNFDNWSRSLPTIKAAKEYLQKIKLENKQDVVFKFIINDDQWIVNDDFKVTHDEHGNSNNIIYADELVEESDDAPVATGKESVNDDEIADEKEAVIEDKYTVEEENPVEEDTPEEEEEEEEFPENKEVSSDEDVFVPPVSSKEEKEVSINLNKYDEEHHHRIGVPKDRFIEEFEQEQEVQADRFVPGTPERVEVSEESVPDANDDEETPEELVAEDLPRDTVVVNEDHESFVEPEISLKSPSKSIITEDDVISDLDTEDHTSKHKGELPQPSSHQQQQPLTQVLTSSSSFAAISSPPLSSDYENLEKYDNEQAKNDLEEDDDETDYNTASNSGIYTDKNDNPLVATYKENKPVKPVLLAHDSETTIGATTPKIPGHYPTSPEHKSSSTTSLSSNSNANSKEPTYTGKRESLISRFKSLFR